MIALSLCGAIGKAQSKVGAQRKVLGIELIGHVQLAGKMNDAVPDPSCRYESVPWSFVLHIHIPLLAIRGVSVCAAEVIDLCTDAEARIEGCWRGVRQDVCVPTSERGSGGTCAAAGKRADQQVAVVHGHFICAVFISATVQKG